MSDKQFKTILKGWKDIREEINKFVHEKNIKELKKSADKFLSNAKKDLKNVNKFIEKDVNALKKEISKREKRS